MGTYKSVRIRADTNNSEEINSIYKMLVDHEAHSCWNQFCESTKWWPEDFVKKLSEAFPKVMFRLDLDGIMEFGPTFYLNGQDLDIFWCSMPSFPRPTAFKRGLKARKNHFKVKAEKEAKQKIEAEAKAKADAEEKERQELVRLQEKYGKVG